MCACGHAQSNGMLNLVACRLLQPCSPHAAHGAPRNPQASLQASSPQIQLHQHASRPSYQLAPAKDSSLCVCAHVCACTPGTLTPSVPQQSRFALAAFSFTTCLLPAAAWPCSAGCGGQPHRQEPHGRPATRQRPGQCRPPS